MQEVYSNEKREIFFGIFTIIASENGKVVSQTPRSPEAEAAAFAWLAETE